MIIWIDINRLIFAITNKVFKTFLFTSVIRLRTVLLLLYIEDFRKSKIIVCGLNIF